MSRVFTPGVLYEPIPYPDHVRLADAEMASRSNAFYEAI